MKKILIVLLSVLAILGFSADYIQANTVIATGVCGDSIDWKLYADGELVISGKGEMWDFEEGDPSWQSYAQEITSVKIESGVTTVGARAFDGMFPNIENVTFPDTLTMIGNFSFLNCEKLGDFTLPNGLTHIGQQAFDACGGITRLVIPDTVTFLDANIVDNCENLEYVYIGGKEDCGMYVHAGSPIGGGDKLERIEVSPNNIALTSVDGVLYSKDKRKLVEYPAGKKDEVYTVLAETKEIDQFACSNKYIKKIVLPEGLQAIWEYAFWDCGNLYELSIPSTVTNVVEHFVDSCYNMVKIENKSNTVLPLGGPSNTVWMDSNGNVVKELGKGVAYQYRPIRSITMPQNLILECDETAILPEDFDYVLRGANKNVVDLVFASSDENVATVSKDGTVTAVGAGVAEITVTSRYVLPGFPNVTAKCIVEVEAPVVLVGWQKNEIGWWYANEDGTYPKDGWKQISGKWYAFDARGYMREGWMRVGENWYYLQPNSGHMVSGWQYINNKLYYFASGGAMVTGWQYIDNTVYYFTSSGALAKGWQSIDGEWYYFKSGGEMTRGWMQQNGIWYYLKSDGTMAKGWLDRNGTWYYFYSNGAMAADTWIGNYYVNSSGAWVR